MAPTIEQAVHKFGKYTKGLYAYKTPLKAGTQFEPATEDEVAAAKHLPYKELIGILVWCTVQVKIECATAVSMLGSHAAKWSEKHFQEALRVLLWMNAHREEGIEFHYDPQFDENNCLYAYADADLAGDPESRKSRSGMDKTHLNKKTMNKERNRTRNR